MDEETAKGLSILILFLLTILFGWLPIWLHHRGSLSATASPRRKLILDIFNCFAGGVFLGTCLLHLLAEGMEDFDSYKELVHFNSDFPVYQTMAGVGVFLVALVDKVGFALMSFPSDKQTETATNRKPDEDSSPQVVYSKNTVSSPSYGATLTTGDAPSGTPMFSGDAVDDHEEQTRLIPASTLKRDTASANCSNGEIHQAEAGHSHHHHGVTPTSTSGHPPDISQVSVIRAFLMLIALSFHTVFDGLAVGLQDTAGQVWQVLAAIAIHKSLVAFCLGLELSVSSPGKPIRPLVFLFLFALISPIGIGVGMAVTSGKVNQVAQLLVSSILQAVATGTFLYVTFFEILSQQFAHNHAGASGSLCLEITKVGVVVLGFACMAGVKLLDKD